MIKAAAERASTSTDHELSSYLLHDRYPDNKSSPFEGDAATSPSPIRSRSKQNHSSSRNIKSRHDGTPSSLDSSPSIFDRNPSNSDWNTRRRSDLSSPTSYASSQRHAADPPRSAKAGMEWVWFPEGYWAEREKAEIGPRRGKSPRKWYSRSPGRRRSSATQKTSEASTLVKESLDTPRMGDTKRTESNISRKSKSSDAESLQEKLRLGFNFMSPTYPHFISPTGEPEGLYCKTKRNVEGRFVPKRKMSIDGGSPFSKFPGVASQTTMVLEGASSFLERSHRERNQRMRGHLEAASPMTPCSPGFRSRRFGLAPWHRRTSFDSLFSVTSSVHQLLQGKTPLATPDTASVCMGRDGLSYPKFDISDVDANAPNFLPSEARRINTPPMSPGTPDTIPRGFFFALTPPGRESKSPASSRSPGAGSSNNSRSPKASSSGDTPTSASREWWDTDPKHPLSPGKSITKILPKLKRGPPAIAIAQPGPPPISPFELNLPDHLPSSPLCPKHPRYVGKGSGVCVYHGRKKSVPLKTRLDSESTIATTITTESVKGE